MINFLDLLTETSPETLVIEQGRLSINSLNFQENPNIPSLENHYPTLINAETWAFIATSEKFTPEKLWGINQPTIDEQRQAYNAFCRHCHQPVAGISRENVTIDGIPIRRYIPTSLSSSHTEILFFHGGGFVVGNLDSHDSICAKLAERTREIVTAVDYRLAPEHPFPAAFEDCFRIYRHLIETSDKNIVVCGDSAGGTLAAAVSALCSQHQWRQPRAQLLIYPYLGGDPQAGSYQQHRQAPMLSTLDMLAYSQCYHGTHMPIDDVRALPILADCTVLPPTICLVYAIDPLADDGKNYCQRLQQAGTEHHLRVVQGLPHGTFRAFDQIKAVADSWDWLIDTYQHLS